MLFIKEQWTIDTRNIGESQNNFGKWKKQAKKKNLFWLYKILENEN